MAGQGGAAVVDSVDGLLGPDLAGGSVLAAQHESPPGLVRTQAGLLAVELVQQRLQPALVRQHNIPYLLAD